MKAKGRLVAVAFCMIFGGCSKVPRSVSEAAFDSAMSYPKPGGSVVVFYGLVMDINTTLHESIIVPVGKVRVVFRDDKASDPYTTVSLNQIKEVGHDNRFKYVVDYYSAKSAEVQVRSKEDFQLWQTWLNKLRQEDFQSIRPKRVLPQL